MFSRPWGKSCVTSLPLVRLGRGFSRTLWGILQSTTRVSLEPFSSPSSNIAAKHEKRQDLPGATSMPTVMIETSPHNEGGIDA